MREILDLDVEAQLNSSHLKKKFKPPPEASFFIRAKALQSSL